MARWEPLSVREGGRLWRLGWRWKGAREAIAVRLAPWLRPSPAPRGTGQVLRDLADRLEAAVARETTGSMDYRQGLLGAAMEIRDELDAMDGGE